MGASVRTEDEAFSDERYADLARAAGLADADHARGKMGRLWRQCTIECTYVLPRETVVSVLGDRGVEALVLSRLGELVDGGVRIRGTRGRVEWLKKLRKNGKFGKRGGRPRKNPDGFPEKPTRVTESAQNITPPAPAPVPTLSPVPTPTGSENQIPTKRSRKSRLETSWVPERSGVNDAAESTARARGVDLRVELLKLRDWADSNAATRADWNAVWRNWTRNAKSGSRNGNQTALELQRERIAMLEEQERREKAEPT